MDWLTTFGPEETFRYEQLAQFRFQGDRVPLTDRGRGIRKPAQLTAALSFSTVYTPPNGVPPYEDAEGNDGLLRYKIRGEDPRHPENVAMRAAHERQLPLIWFVGVASGLYLPRYPVYLVGEEHGQFVVALDQAQRNMFAAQNADVNEDDRRYAEAITRRRLHQPLFRARVLQAYESRCSMCHLRHASLLDASHILDDKHALGQPIVPNGLALCKIHHAGFDQNIIGVSPDLKISVRRDILDEIDGPMLKYGIQALEGQRLTVPRQRVAAPDRERLAVRFSDFQTAAA
jgi:putative restriction endonuclease